jgi:hypothetical protein
MMVVDVDRMSMQPKKIATIDATLESKSCSSAVWKLANHVPRRSERVKPKLRSRPPAGSTMSSNHHTTMRL